ncbi:MAG TPA: NADP-dependent oxidoreductase [Opitutaceae bacterium]|nr:NADP-dependent oxidoreductase [Opitutaceae bacterium]
MKAIRIHSFGGSDVLNLEDVPAPQPKMGEVLIKVQAAGVNPVDYKMRSGKYKADRLHPPLTLGREVSGVVEGVGADVTEIEVGDNVYAFLASNSGGYAEYVVAQVNETATKPATLEHIRAAGVPLAAITAWQGLFDHGKLRAGERVLIHGAAGGVGHFAVQFAKNRGAYVIATASGEDADLLRKLGADEIINYHHERFEDRVREVDLVFDLVAGDTQQRSWRVLKDGGRIISTLQPPDRNEAVKRHALARSFMAEPSRDQLTEIARLIDAGKVSVVLDQTLPLAEARRAHDHLENDHIRGKVVLSVGG